MRKLNQILPLLIIGLMVVGVSCTDLSEQPYDEITEENFNPTERDIPRVVAPIYTNLRSFMACCYGFVTMQESAADNFVTPARPNGWGGPYLPYHRHEWRADHLYVTANWNSLFNGVNSANRVLYQIESGVVPASDDIKTQLIAEIKTVRAFYYYLLMDNFGSVPLTTDFQSEELPQQATREELYNFIIDELTTNIPDLNETVGQSTYGRMTKWAGKTLLAEVYLNSNVYVGQTNYDKVIDLTNEVIESDNYSLDPDYEGPFSRTNQNSPEIIFAIPYDEINAGGNTMHMRTVTPQQQEIYGMRAQPWGGSSSTPGFIETYDEDDTRLEDTWAGGPQVTAQGDTVINFVKDMPGIDNSPPVEWKHGYRVDKYEIYQNMTASSDVDFPIYRYAEVLMMKAEALLRTGAADAAALIVTDIRQRAFADTDPSKAPVTGAELMGQTNYDYGYWETNEQVNFIDQPEDDIEYGRFLDELGWEFAVEGHRRQDLIRFGVYNRKGWFQKHPSDPCRSIFPISQDALEENSNLTQHPCYQ